jgi:aspartyl-tRNA(Asn)/glutamyl-tRNA(Gln) amidotransferase subunit B
MWDIIIGLETHVQLATDSKIFSASSTNVGAKPNAQASFIDLALPGTLPMLNKKVLLHSVRLGLALNATIREKSVFDRKHYFYPDSPKGYQTSQLYQPIVENGVLPFYFNQEWQSIQIVRAHLEEDAGKSLHEDFHGSSGIDLNRAGTPLLEIVTGPELTSAAQAVAYAKALHALVKWLGISDGNMQEGSFRCDANVSIKPKGATELGTRCEIKNLNSFKFLEEAIESEIQRQIELIEEGGRVIQQTRLYNPETKTTHAMRSKEDAQDYRYFPCPDLLPVYVDAAFIEATKLEMPILPKAMFDHLIEEGLSQYDAQIITQNLDLCQYYQKLVTKNLPAKLIANWLAGEVSAYLNKSQLEFKDFPIKTHDFADLLNAIQSNQISHKMAKEIFVILCDLKDNPAQKTVQMIINEQGLSQISDQSSLLAMIDEVLATQEKLVQEYHSGKEKAFNALIGQLMKASQGRANPQELNMLLKERLKI